MSIDEFFDSTLYDKRVGPGSRVSAYYEARALEETGPILELGCGTGDVLIRIARAGAIAVGIDVSAEMLGALESRVEQEPPEIRAQVSWEQQDAISLSLPTTFRQVFATNEFCSLILDDESLLEVFRRCHSHLVSGGRMILDLPSFDVSYLACFSRPENWVFRDRGLFRVEEDRSVRVSERTIFDERTRLLDALFRYEEIDRSGGVVASRFRRLRLRPRTEAEVILLLRLAGFERLSVRDLPDQGEEPGEASIVVQLCAFEGFRGA